MGYEKKNYSTESSPKGNNSLKKKKKTGKSKNGKRKMHKEMKKRNVEYVENKEAKQDMNREYKVNKEDRDFESFLNDIEYKCHINNEAKSHVEIQDEDTNAYNIEIESPFFLAREKKKLLEVNIPEVAADSVVVNDHTIHLANERKDCKGIHNNQLSGVDDMVISGECISVPVGLVSILRAKKKFICNKYNINIYSWGKNNKIKVTGTSTNTAMFSAALEHLVEEKIQDTTIKFKNLIQNKDTLQKIANTYGVDIESSCTGKNNECISVFGEGNNVQIALTYIASLTIYPGILVKKAVTCQNKKRLTFSETNTRIFVDRKSSMHGYFICEETEEMNFSEGHREEYVRKFGYDK